jgi:ZIP family zinc transporter
MILAACLTFVSTTLGGLTSLRFRDQLHLILGFAAGVLLGVVAFDLLPEIMRLVAATGASPRAPMVALVVGFFAFHIAERTAVIHQVNHRHGNPDGHSPHIGVLSALALTGHSFMDGVGIGLGFQVSTTVGVAVAFAVISHDFCDGLNTASLMLVNRNGAGRTLAFVLLDAAAPLFGALSTKLFVLPPSWLIVYLGCFAGFLLCIGATDILPEAYEHKLSFKPMVMALLGAAATFFITKFA